MSVKKFISLTLFLFALVACTPNSQKEVINSKQIGIRPLQMTPTVTQLPQPIQVVLATSAPPQPSSTATVEPTEILPPLPTMPPIEMEPTTPPTVAPVPPVITNPITTHVDDVYPVLMGSWAWQSSFYYFVAEGGPNVETPATTGEEVTFDFGEDRILREYVNGTLVREVSYSVEQAGAAWLLYIDGAMSWLELSDQDLMISTAPVDGPMSFYARVEVMP